MPVTFSGALISLKNTEVDALHCKSDSKYNYVGLVLLDWLSNDSHRVQSHSNSKSSVCTKVKAIFYRHYAKCNVSLFNYFLYIVDEVSTVHLMEL